MDSHSKSFRALPSSLRFIWGKFRKTAIVFLLIGFFVGGTIGFLLSDNGLPGQVMKLLP